MRHKCLVGSVLVAMGCGASPDADEAAVGATRSAITGGTLLTQSEHVAPHTSVIKIQMNDLPKTCTALKVGTSLFWTAAHCAEGTTVVDMTNRLDGKFEGPTYHRKVVSSVTLHPSYINYIERFGVDSATFVDHYDVARFTVQGTTHSIPAYAKAEAGFLFEGTSVNYTGYGCDLNNTSHDWQKQRASFTLANIIEWIQADPKDRIGYYLHNAIALGESPQGCAGDSGSPLFTWSGSEWRIAGIAIHRADGEHDKRYTAWSRYSNVRNWMQSPAHNDFRVGFQGYIFNQMSGRCIDNAVNITDQNCAPYEQEASTLSWTLADSGRSGYFYLVNGATQKCLDTTSAAEGANLVERTCAPRSTAITTQKWKFSKTLRGTRPIAADLYYRLSNGSSLCVTTANPEASDVRKPLQMQECAADSTWRKQAWVMTR